MMMFLSSMTIILLYPDRRLLKVDLYSIRSKLILAIGYLVTDLGILASSKNILLVTMSVL